MTALNKIVAAFSPPETEQDWNDAREFAMLFAKEVPWLSEVLRHHQQISDAFALIKKVDSRNERKATLSTLSMLIAGNSLAEEIAIYPALSSHCDSAYAKKAYVEKSCAKIQLGRLEEIDFESREFETKLGHLESAIKHHMYQEESLWFIELIENAPLVDHDVIAERYIEEFQRYMKGNPILDTSIQHNFIAATAAASRLPMSIHEPA